MRKHITLMLLSLLFLFSCAEKQDSIQEKAQNLIIKECADACASACIPEPAFKFNCKIEKYDKEEYKSFEPLSKHIVKLDEHTAEEIGYMLKYIASLNNNTYIFIATFDKKCEKMITNDLYDDSLCGDDVVDVKTIVK